jgi:hypothetical protein
MTPVSLYQAAFTGLSHHSIDFSKRGRTITDPSILREYEAPADNEMYDLWLANYTFNYQLFSKNSTRVKNYLKMKVDLDSYFGIDAKVQKRKIKTVVLVNTGNFGKLKTKGGKPYSNFVELGLKATDGDSLRVLSNMPFQFFVDNLQAYIQYHFAPFQNKVSFPGNIDIAIPGDVLDSFDMVGLRRSLKKYGLDLIPTEKWMDVLIISGKKREE